LSGQAVGLTMFRTTSVLLLLLGDVLFCVPQRFSAVEDKLATYLTTEYETMASKARRKYSLASWNYQTDVSNKIKVEELVSKVIIITFCKTILYRDVSFCILPIINTI
jgi:hypothetical protein